MFVIVILLQFCEYTPFMKGTSDENEIKEVLDRVKRFVYPNEFEPKDNVLRLGRSTQSIINHHT